MPALAEWLRAHQPTSPAPTIIHNDYKFDNVIYATSSFEKIVGVLDWEMATVGDPLMDLGTMLCYWVQASDPPPVKAFGFGPTTLPGMLTRQELADRYAAATGRDISNIVFYFTFGLFKTAVVLQQIYYRYHQGLTKDPRFAAFIDGVRLLALMADRAVTTETL
jgi:aminoglycoside phosphotransferase (APT) family kinase protein